MQCPNCGRYIRSTSQCAYCGHEFTPAEVAEMKKKSEPQTSRSSKGGLSILWNIVKLVVALMVIFLLFVYGPTYASKLMNYFGSSNEDTAQLVETSEEEIEQDDEPSQEVEQQEEGSEQAVEEEQTSLVIKDHQVDVALYPQIKVEMDFEGDVDAVDANTFTFEVNNQGNVVSLEDYSLQKDGQKITLTYNDPSLSVVGSDDLDQGLTVMANDYDLHEEIVYQLPAMTVDESLAAKFNDIMSEEFGSTESIHAAVHLSDQEVPFLYNDRSVEASELIALFAIARAYDVNEGQNLEDLSVKIEEALIAANDQGEVAEHKGEEMKLNELFSEAIQSHDATAINHIIQATGGPNEFNRWLKEKGYFATKITQQLDVDADGTITGAITSAQDVSQLLTDLVKESLLSADASHDYLELLRSSPATNKFPSEGMHEINILSRSELVTSDENRNQYYAGVVETNEDRYVIVILNDDAQEDSPTVDQIAHSIQSLILYFETGSTEPAPIPEPEPEPVPVPQPAPAPEPIPEPQPEPVQPQLRPWEVNPDEWHRGEDGLWYNNDPNYQYD